ncbi:MAG: hypothetical protein COS85_19690 [Armatimonadetes bacterium CG07_land_8_20_14_0_80_59_28]|nr:MAG: hypothetical protein COS85_19690 [Armatimonadetes bacterium CG07_land_8_20_14_0_80_59_28]PIX39472.1 MAG: hypothetical protein COZ56_17455 [Armatimonadetes bacterium CG_4_8_14_3_um_filter_58_9]PIY48803.1 MAG: hypothetical protein COZ05_02055 [Armatimonadetes bacterium CG_4_10_14_3_um_filter_59_10]
MIAGPSEVGEDSAVGVTSNRGGANVQHQGSFMEGKLRINDPLQQCSEIVVFRLDLRGQLPRRKGCHEQVQTRCALDARRLNGLIGPGRETMLLGSGLRSRFGARFADALLAQDGVDGW